MNSNGSPYHFLSAPASPTRGSVTVYVTDALRQAIVTLALKPGEIIDKGALCERLGVSRFPVSEALARLQAEGLVDILPQRGSIVSLVRIADVLEYMLIRKALEAEAVRVVTGNHSDELFETLERNMSYQRAAAEIDDQQGFHERDLEFHDIILGDMSFTKVKGVIEQTRANLDRARRLILTLMPLDTFVDEQAIGMEVVGNPKKREQTHKDFDRIVKKHEPEMKLTLLERFAFYDRVRGAYAIVQTGERRLYGNVLLKKGIIRPS